jgi:hypothetical protein
MTKNLHPVARDTRAAVERVHPRPEGIRVTGSDRTVVPVQVSKALIPRLTRFVDAFLRTAERRGYEAGVDDSLRRGNSARPAIVVRGHKVTFNITEGLIRTTHQPTAEERDRKARYQYAFIPKYDHTPNGVLRLTITNCYGGRTRWSDRKGATLDQLIDAILDGMEAHARADEERTILRQREEHDLRQRQIAALERGYQDFLKARRVTLMLEHAAAWRRAEEFRAYLGEVRLRAEKAGEITREVEEWIDFAQHHLDTVLDPPGSLPELPEDLKRSAAEVAAHLANGYARWSDAYQEWLLT